MIYKILKFNLIFNFILSPRIDVESEIKFLTNTSKYHGFFFFTENIMDFKNYYNTF